MRALLVLAQSYDQNPKQLVKGDMIATSQEIPVKFLEGILRQLRQTGIVASQRGAEGGYRLDKSPDQVSIAGASAHLREVWVAVRAAMRHVLEDVSLADVAAGTLPPHVRDLIADPAAWHRR
jgi:DNA-binding IscR family transcriptional regulator